MDAHTSGSQMTPAHLANASAGRTVPAGGRPVRLQLRRLQHECGDQQYCHGSGDYGAGGAVGHYVLHPDHGRSDDPWEQTHRNLGRRRCFVLGLIVYGVGALLATFARGLGLLFVGYSLLEGIGSALLIPPVYILITVSLADMQSRAKWFGIVSAAAGVGAAAGPLIGGLITSAISWRASFVFQVLLVAAILVVSRRIVDPGMQGARPHFDLEGSVLSAVGLVFVVFGILQSGAYGWVVARQAFYVGSVQLIPQGGISPVWLFIVIGGVFLAWFFSHIRSYERAGKEPLVASRMFRNRVSNLGLATQCIQWLTMQGSFFVISASSRRS